MTPREAEKLLGGYATGTLTEAERKTLFAAALEDQALFDALADEEGLRALLAEPDARARVVAALGKPIVPFWRRPATMGLAASLLVAVGVSVLLRHVPAPEPARVPPPPPSDEKVQATPAQAPLALKAAKRVPQAEPLTPKVLRSAPPPPPLPPASPAANAADVAEMAAGVSNPTAQAAPAPMEQAEGAAGEMRAKTEAKRNAEAAASSARFADSTQGLSMRGVRESLASLLPTWSFEPALAGQFKLKVLWGPQGHLYLLHRDPAGVSSLAPTSMAAQPDGKMASYFRGSVGTQDKLDLYLLPEAAGSPASLPDEGPVPGFRARVWPREKKTP